MSVVLFGEFLVHRVHRLQCADAGYLLGIYKHGEMFRFTQSTYALTLMNMIRQPFSFDHDAEDYMNSHRTAKQLIDETLHPEITRTWHESNFFTLLPSRLYFKSQGRLRGQRTQGVAVRYTLVQGQS